MPSDEDIPKKYKVVRILGEGGFGEVLQCQINGSNQTVAIKMPKFRHEDNEASFLEKLMSLNFHKHNIVRFYESFPTRHGKAMVFEILHMSLFEYITKTHCAPMRLSSIRTIIQQMATALDALKSIGIIHTDVKLDNVMLVNQEVQPFKVKLIDFGLALHRSKVTKRMRAQTVCTRAPEIILGNHFSEAIDMWALGCLMFSLITGRELHLARNEYEVMQHIVEILGLPPDHLLNNGRKTKRYFNKTDTNGWKLKTPEEYWPGVAPVRSKHLNLQCLDDLKKVRQERENEYEAIERDQCIELLKAMLTLDPNERITPSEVHQHPFITRCHIRKNAAASDQQSSSTTTSQRPANDTRSDSRVNNTPGRVVSPPVKKISDCGPPAAAVKEDTTTNTHPSAAMIIQLLDSIKGLKAEHKRTLESSVKDNKKAQDSTAQDVSKKKETSRIRDFFCWMGRTLNCFRRSNRISTMSEG